MAAAARAWKRLNNVWYKQSITEQKHSNWFWTMFLKNLCMLPLSESFLLTSENQTYSTSPQISKLSKRIFKNLRGSQLVMRWPVICWLRLLLPLLLLLLQSWSHLIRYTVSWWTSLLWKSKSKTCWVPRVKDPPVWKLEKNEKVSFLRNVGLQPQQHDKCLFPK